MNKKIEKKNMVSHFPVYARAISSSMSNAGKPESKQFLALVKRMTAL